MNLYRVLGDRVGTPEARDLAQQLVSWHDAMVRHLRSGGQDGRSCSEECPHAEARVLWAAALDVFGSEVGALQFLRAHGSRPPRVTGARTVAAHG